MDLPDRQIRGFERVIYKIEPRIFQSDCPLDEQNNELSLVRENADEASRGLRPTQPARLLSNWLSNVARISVKAA